MAVEPRLLRRCARQQATGLRVIEAHEQVCAAGQQATAQQQAPRLRGILGPLVLASKSLPSCARSLLVRGLAVDAFERGDHRRHDSPSSPQLESTARADPPLIELNLGAHCRVHPPVEGRAREQIPALALPPPGSPKRLAQARLVRAQQAEVQAEGPLGTVEHPAIERHARHLLPELRELDENQQIVDEIQNSSISRARMRRPQISIIGSASGPDALLQLARELGEAVVDQGWRIVCGGLGGVMQAAAEGARRSAKATGADVVGVLPTLDPSTANPCVDIVLPTGMQVARNAIVVASGDVVIALGGGSGTLSELALAWQMDKPLVALSTQGGWAAELAGRSLDARRSDSIHAAHNVGQAIARTRELLASSVDL